MQSVFVLDPAVALLILCQQEECDEIASLDKDYQSQNPF